MPESRKIAIVYAHPTGTLDEYSVTVPVGWDEMNGAGRRKWATRWLRRKDSTLTYRYFERRQGLG